MLTSIEKQDLITWKVLFYEVSRICKWTEEIRLEVLTQIVDLSIQHRIGVSTSSMEMLDKIMKLKYNANTAYEYQTRLMAIRQTDFYTIRAYANKIENLCMKIGFCLDWNEQMIRAKVEETFFAGLHEKVKFELVRYNNRSFAYCIRYY